jgi:hypothetical protein
MPIPNHFLTDVAAAYEGTPFADVEIQDAAEYLSDKGLIKGVGVPQIRGPVRAEITTEGIDCVIDWDGDVAKYLRDQRGYGPTYLGPVVHGNADGGQWAWNNRDVVQHRIDGQQVVPGFELIAEAAASLLRQLPNLGLTSEDQRDIEEVANEVLAEVKRPEPQRSKLRKATAALRGFLIPITAGAAAGVSDEVRELTRQAIDHLTSAL